MSNDSSGNTGELSSGGSRHHQVYPTLDERLDIPIVVPLQVNVLRRPSNRAVADAIGLSPDRLNRASFDLVVVGAGPAGLAAAVCAASEGLKVVVLDATAPGGQAGTSPSHRPLSLREHQIQILNRSTGCAFAKIIENRGQQDVPVLHVGKYAKAHVVRTVQRLRIQVLQRARFVQRQDTYVGRFGIVACEACV